MLSCFIYFSQENEEMMRRLARKTREKNGGRTQSESNTVQSLARMAGIDLGKNVPGAPKDGGRRGRRSRSRTR